MFVVRTAVSTSAASAAVHVPACGATEWEEEPYDSTPNGEMAPNPHDSYTDAKSLKNEASSGGRLVRSGHSSTAAVDFFVSGESGSCVQYIAVSVRAVMGAAGVDVPNKARKAGVSAFAYEYSFLVAAAERGATGCSASTSSIESGARSGTKRGSAAPPPAAAIAAASARLLTTGLVPTIGGASVELASSSACGGGGAAAAAASAASVAASAVAASNDGGGGGSGDDDDEDDDDDAAAAPEGAMRDERECRARTRATSKSSWASADARFEVAIGLHVPSARNLL